MTRQFERLSEGVAAGIWDIGFEDPESRRYDETQFDLVEGEGARELWGLWVGFCEDNGWNPYEVTVEYVSVGVEC